MLDCPECEGMGCDECDGEGDWRLETCPLEFVGPAGWDVVGAAELYEKGLGYVAGGVADQAHAFVEACRFVWREQARWRAELEIPGDAR